MLVVGALLLIGLYCLGTVGRLIVFGMVLIYILAIKAAFDPTALEAVGTIVQDTGIWML